MVVGCIVGFNILVHSRIFMEPIMVVAIIVMSHVTVVAVHRLCVHPHTLCVHN